MRVHASIVTNCYCTRCQIETEFCCISPVAWKINNTSMLPHIARPYFQCGPLKKRQIFLQVQRRGYWLWKNSDPYAGILRLVICNFSQGKLNAYMKAPSRRWPWNENIIVAVLLWQDALYVPVAPLRDVSFWQGSASDFEPLTFWIRMT